MLLHANHEILILGIYIICVMCIDVIRWRIIFLIDVARHEDSRDVCSVKSTFWVRYVPIMRDPTAVFLNQRVAVEVQIVSLSILNNTKYTNIFDTIYKKIISI